MGKVCFIISSIGERDSEERKSADEKYDLVYEPVLKDLGYEPVRADKETTPNSIPRDIIKRIINSDLLLADVSDENANVFYELAVRNAVKKPVIIIMRVGQTLPFDIKDKRGLELNMKDNRQWVKGKDLLKDYIKSAETNPSNASISILTDFQFNLVAGNMGEEKEKQLDITLRLKDIGDGIDRITSIVNSLQKSNTISALPTDAMNSGTFLGFKPRYVAPLEVGRMIYSDEYVNVTSRISETPNDSYTIKITNMTVRTFLDLICKELLRSPYMLKDYGKTWVTRDHSLQRIFLFNDNYDVPLNDVGIFSGMSLVIDKLPLPRSN
jgi:hypothetical protein